VKRIITNIDARLVEIVELERPITGSTRFVHGIDTIRARGIPDSAAIARRAPAMPPPTVLAEAKPDLSAPRRHRTPAPSGNVVGLASAEPRYRTTASSPAERHTCGVMMTLAGRRRRG
jgi:hypothetical protein